MEVSKTVVALAPRAFRFFLFITRFPRSITAVGLVVLIVLTSQVFTIVRDTTVDAFMRSDHPAVVYRDRVEEIFGLRDPIVVAVLKETPDGIYNPETFRLVERITEALRGVKNVDPEKVRSLVTEKNIVGTEDRLIVEPFLDPMPNSMEDARRVRKHIEQIPLYMGTLVARDGTGTLVSAELLDQKVAGQTYEAIEKLIADLDTSGHRILIAGEGAVSGYLSIYLNQDARKMQPAAFLVILLIMFIAFRSGRAFVIPLLIIAATVGGAMGLMGAAGIPYYIITAALPVILIGIAVADSIHVLSRYYEEQAMDPRAPQRILVVRSMAVMWRPVVLTSLTTIAGFVGISTTSGMPPMLWFGVFASIGVILALIFSLIFLPAIMCLFGVRPSPAFQPNKDGESFDIFARMLARVGSVSVHHPRAVLGLAASVVLLGILGALMLETDTRRIDSFASSAVIYDAHHEINKRFNGTSYLDIIVEAPEEDGLLEPRRLKKIDGFQAYLETLPNVQATVSIVDYLKQINKAMNANDPAYYRIPESSGEIAESFLLYESTGGPTDFQEEIDYGYRQALIRVMINESQYSLDREIVLATTEYIDTAFADNDLTVNLSGRVNVDYHWIMPLTANHFASVGVSLSLVFIMSAFLFRSVLAGLLTLAPVTVAALSVYAVMGLSGIWLEVASSMFAAIAIGLGVDFAIHIVDRMRYLLRERGMDMATAVRELHLTAGRALFFNFLALFLGFGVLMISDMPPIFRLGLMITVAMAANFIAAVIVMPALIAIIRPKFCGLEGWSVSRSVKGAGVSCLFALIMLVGVVGTAEAEDQPLTGLDIARKVDARPEPSTSREVLEMRLINRRGGKRTRKTVVLERLDAEMRKVAIYFEEPTRVKGTAFLYYDFADDAKEDSRWLYLPRMRRTRRISASERGDYFLGTDFTYQDIQDQTKFALEDYDFELSGTEDVDGVTAHRLTVTPKTAEIAKELGYSRFEAWIDPRNWMPVKSRYWDTNGNDLKTITIADHVEVQGFWTALRITAVNHKTGHRSEFVYSDVAFDVEISDRTLSRDGLPYGPDGR